METVPLDQAAELREAMRLFRASTPPSLRAPMPAPSRDIPMARPASPGKQTPILPRTMIGENLNSAVGDGAAAARITTPHSQARSFAIIAVVSGKGGVGKTHVAVNLSLLLGKRGIGALLIDVDAGAANADVMLRIDPHPTLADYLSGRCSRAQLVRPIGDRVRFVPGYSGPASARESYFHEANEVRRVAEELVRDERFVILDCGAGVGPAVLGPACAADVALIVTTPEPTALADAYALIKVMNRHEPRSAKPLLIVNQVQSACEARHVHERIASTARRFLSVDVVGAGFVRSDRHVVRSVMQRRPLATAYPGCRAARDLSDAARHVLQHVQVPALRIAHEP